MSTLSQTGTADTALSTPEAGTGASALRAIVYGGLIAGALDITDAFVTNALLAARPSPVRVLQSIAGGLLGPASFEGGLSTAALGLLCHFTIALGAATVYVLASRKLPVLLRHPGICGIAFGVAVHLFMQTIVLPLSAVRMSTAPTPFGQLVNQYLIHALGVGLPIALAARQWARKRA